MTERSLYPESVEVRQRDLAYTESTKSEQLRQRLLDTLGSVRRGGLATTVNGVDLTRIDVAAGRGYTPNGELAELTVAQTAISLSDYTDGVDNFVYLTYREQETTPAAHETDGSTRTTRTEALVGISVLTSAEFVALPATNDADLTTLAQDRMLLIATVNADGVGNDLESDDITLEPIVTLATAATVAQLQADVSQLEIDVDQLEVDLDVEEDARRRLGFIPDVDAAAVGDGIADDTAALNAAILAAPVGGVLDLGGKTYKINGTLVVSRDDITVANGKLDATGLTGSFASAIRCTTTSPPLGTNAVSLTANALSGVRTLTVASTAGIFNGDIILLHSDYAFAEGSAVPTAELLRVKSVDSLTQLTVTRRILFDYLTADNSFIERYDVRRNVRFENLEIIGATPGVGTDVRAGIELIFTDGVKVNNVETTGIYTYGVTATNCYDTLITDCNFLDLQAADSLGVVIFAGFNAVVTTTNVDDAGSAVGVRTGAYGPAISVTVDNCNLNGRDAVCSFTRHTYDHKVTNCELYGVPSATGEGVYSEGANLTVSNCTIHNVSREGIFWKPFMRPLPSTQLTDLKNSAIIINNEIFRAALGGITCGGTVAARQMSALLIAGNTLIECSSYGIQVTASGSGGVGRTRVVNNSIEASEVLFRGIILNSDANHFAQTNIDANTLFMGNIGSIGIDLIASGGFYTTSIQGNAIEAEICVKVEGAGAVESMTINGSGRATGGSAGSRYGVQLLQTGAVEWNSISLDGSWSGDGGLASAFTHSIKQLSINGNWAGTSLNAIRIVMSGGTPEDININATATSTTGTAVFIWGQVTTRRVSVRGSIKSDAGNGLYLLSSTPTGQSIEDVVVDATITANGASQNGVLVEHTTTLNTQAGGYGRVIIRGAITAVGAGGRGIVIRKVGVATINGVIILGDFIIDNASISADTNCVLLDQADEATTFRSLSIVGGLYIQPLANDIIRVENTDLITVGFDPLQVNASGLQTFGGANAINKAVFSPASVRFNVTGCKFLNFTGSQFVNFTLGPTTDQETGNQT